MTQLYFCGKDMWGCLGLQESDYSEDGSVRSPVLLQENGNIEFNHFYALRKQDNGVNSFSWYINGLGLSNTEIFAYTLEIQHVALSKNAIVGISEDGRLYRIDLEADESGEVVSFKTSEIKSKIETQISKIVASEDYIYGLESSPVCSNVYKIKSTLELVAEFPGKCLIDLAVGYGHFVALSDTGAVWNWGNCGRSELASCNDVNVMKVCEQPLRVEFFDDLPSMVVKVCCGGWHTLALTADGDVYSWGWNESGQLGHNFSTSRTNEPHPVDLGSAEDPVVDICAGNRHSVALLKSDSLYSWGRNEEGQCGLVNIKNSCSEPQNITKCWKGVVSNIKCGSWSTIIVTN